MNTKSIFLLIGICILFGGIFLLLKQKKATPLTSTFVVGTAAGYAPFVSINQKNEYEGFDIDIAHNIATVLGKTLEIKDLGSMAPLFIALEQENIDAIIWGLSITQERLQKVAMVRYQGETVRSYPLIFWKIIPDSIKSITDMNGMTICVEPTSSQDAVLSNYPDIIKKPTEKVDDALLNIQYAKADAALVEPAIAKKFKNKFSQIQILEVPLASKDQVHGIGIAIKKENGALIQEIQKAVRMLQNNGIITTLQKKWNIE